MILRAANRGSGSGCFMRFLFLIVAGFLLISWLPRCAQQLPQLASHTASETATGVADAAAGAVSNLGRALLNRIASLFSSARDQWNNASPADRFDLVCEHVPVEGVDKLCPYFTSALQGASDAQTAQIACYWHAAATGPNPQQTLQQINNACPRVAGDPSRLQSCLAEYVEPGDASSCLASSPEQLWSELHTMIEPIACPPGLPKSWCTTQSSTAAAATQNASPPPRTDPNYLSCLQKYYTAPAVQATIGTSCGTQVNAGNATCVANSLQTFNYPGQTNLGQQYVSYCQAQPQ